MVDTNKLRAAWVEKGLTQAQVADKIGLSSRVMTSRMAKCWFGSDEIERLINVLQIKDPVSIFFARQ